MSQTVFSTINPSSTSGTQLASILVDFKDAIISGFSGTSRPSEIDPGGYWIDMTNNPTSWDFKIFDGTTDITVFTINLTTGTVVIASVANLFAIEKISADSLGPIFRLIKERIATNGQVLDGDTLGEIQFLGTTDAGSNVVMAKIVSFASDNVTASAQGAYLSFRVTPDGTASLAEAMRLQDGKLGVMTQAPTDTIHAVGNIKAENISDSTASSDVILKKKRVTGSGGVLNSDTIGEVTYNSTSDVGGDIPVASIEVSARENHTSIQQGSKIVIKNKKLTESAFTEQIVIEEGVFIPNLSVTNLVATNTELGTVVETEDAQFVLNKDGTQAMANAAPAGIKIEMTDATDAALAYDSSLASKFKIGNEGTLKEVVTVGDTQILTDKTLTSPALNSPSVVTPTRLDVKQDTEANLITYAATATNGQIVYATDSKKMYQVVDNALVAIGGGGASSYVSNFDAEVNANGHVAYQDAASAVPVDATGGTPSVTATRTTSSPLEGVGSFLVTKDAVNRQGEGVGIAFTIPAGRQGSFIPLNLTYETSANYVDGDARIYIIDVTNTRVIEMALRDIPANSRGILQAGFQASINSTSYRIAIHVASTSALAWTIKYDEVIVYPRPQVKGMAGTDWKTDYTPTYTGVGTVTNNSARYRIVGDSLEIEASFITGTVANSLFSMTLPSGLSIDSAKVPISNNTSNPGQSVGQYRQGATAFGNIVTATATSTTLLYSSNGAPALIPVNGNTSFAGSLTTSISVKIPIAGRSSNLVLSEDAGNRLVETSARGNGGQAQTADVTNMTFSTTIYDRTGSWNGTQFTVPETGSYKVTGSARFTASTVARIYSWINGVQSKAGNSGASSNVQAFTIEERWVQGQVITFRADTNSTLQNSSTDHWITISKNSSPQTILESERIAVRAISTSGQSIPNNSVTTVTWDTAKTFDSHNALNTSTGIFTAPAPGLYGVKASLLTGTVAWTATTHTLTIELHKNGALYSRFWVPIQSSVTNAFSMHLADEVEMVTGDTLSIRLTINRGASTVLSSGGNWNYMSIVRIK